MVGAPNGGRVGRREVDGDGEINAGTESVQHDSLVMMRRADLNTILSETVNRRGDTG
jgi:hypothetical protein